MVIASVSGPRDVVRKQLAELAAPPGVDGGVFKRAVAFAMVELGAAGASTKWAGVHISVVDNTTGDGETLTVSVADYATDHSA